MLQCHIRVIECCDAHVRPASPRRRHFRADHARLRRDPQPGSARLRRQASPQVRVAPPGAARGARRAAEGVRSGQTARLPAGDEDRSAKADWVVAPQPKDMLDRRVEITGPTDRKMVINALNCGAVDLHGGLRGRQLPDLAQHDRRADQPARRGAPHDHARAERQELPPERQDRGADPAAARLAPRREARHRRRQAGVRRRSSTSRCYFFHNAKELLARGSGPYFYLPKMESHLEARLWNDIFVAAQNELGIPQGSIKATALIETVRRRLRDGRDPVRAARRTRRASTSGAGTTSFPASRNSAPTRISASPTARR